MAERYCPYCETNHEIMITPGIEDGYHCPYDPKGEVVLVKSWRTKKFVPGKREDAEWAEKIRKEEKN